MQKKESQKKNIYKICRKLFLYYYYYSCLPAHSLKRTLAEHQHRKTFSPRHGTTSFNAILPHIQKASLCLSFLRKRLHDIIHLIMLI